MLWPRRDPPAPAGAEPNDRATVMHLSDGEFDLLLTADAESNVVAGLDLPVVEAMKVAHHGSDDPGLPGLLQRLRPHVAVVEVGARNLYGHPTPVDARGARRPPSRSSGAPIATARCGCAVAGRPHDTRARGRDAHPDA